MNSRLIGHFRSSDCLVDLHKVYPLGKALVRCAHPCQVSYSLDGIRYFSSTCLIHDGEFDFGGLIARFIRLDCDFEIEIYQGEGYLGVRDARWTELFASSQYWTGGDGLYSFNLIGGDHYDDGDEIRTFCVFGDTFATTIGKGNLRLDPIAMPNNSYCIVTGKKSGDLKADFHIFEDEKGHCGSYLIPETAQAYEGTLADHLVDYYADGPLLPYLSGYDPKTEIRIEFEFGGKYPIDYIDIYNFFIDSEEDVSYSDRGVRSMKILLEDEEFSTVSLKKASYKRKGKNFDRIAIDREVRKIAFVIPNRIGKGNFGGANKKEPFYGLNKVFFHRKNGGYLNDIRVVCNSEFLKKSKHAWFWLQDGIVIGRKFYSLPFTVVSDPTQPEGFQFRLEGISLVECDLRNGDIDFMSARQRPTNLLRRIDGREWTFGCAFYEDEKDGYIYIYGYTSMFFEMDYGKRLRVARVKKEAFDDIDRWRYFDGNDFVPEMENACPILDHVSTELSVHKDGDSYIAIFTYDVQSRYVAYAIAPTPYGPFGEIRIAYVCPEDLCSRMYIYNAKAHPHLSEEGNILVSYNINTSDFDENIRFGRTYGPRFIRLRKIGGQDEI